VPLGHPGDTQVHPYPPCPSPRLTQPIEAFAVASERSLVCRRCPVWLLPESATGGGGDAAIGAATATATGASGPASPLLPFRFRA
jgi:hypothetical protein